MSLFGFLRKEQVSSDIYNDNPVLLDVRTREEFAYGNVPDSINIPLNELPGRIAELKKQNRPVVAFCRSGMRSGQAKMILEQEGILTHNGGSWNNVARHLMSK